ncbi:MAG: M15 family metallopeptidase [Oscillospiraceae bacterium]|nr:M15 family metallopeptidase [Oscillospiraceae bacterium]
METNIKKPKSSKDIKKAQKNIIIACCSILGVIVLGFATYGGYKMATDFGKVEKPKAAVAEPVTTREVTTTEAIKQFWWETNSFEQLSTDPALNGKDDLHNGTLILVNSDWAYCGDSSEVASIYENRGTGENKAPYSVKDRDVSLRLPVINSLNDMFKGFYAATNISDVFVESGYRTKEYQEALYVNGDPNYIQMPGFSEHESGYAVDFAIMKGEVRHDFEEEGDYAWIHENAHNYGFILRYPADKIGFTGIAHESWHFRYVGVPHATYMYENNLCLEEYITLLHDYKYDKEHLYVKTTGNIYEIYYVPSDPTAMITQVPVYDDSTYEVSGNNTDGYIITIERGSDFTIPTYTEETVTVNG